MSLVLIVPITFAGVGIPSEAMNVGLSGPALRRARGRTLTAARRSPQVDREQPATGQILPMFTTESVRHQFLADTQQRVTLDVFKEQFFKTHVPYGEIIYREARKNNLPPELVAAMVHTESDFRATLVSNKSAQGLMQIVPETARILGIANSFDPEQNIAAGTKYFRYLLTRFDDQRIALAAYDAGPTNVERFGGVPPFPETQAYIEKVNRRHIRYRERVRNGYATTMRLGTGA